MSRKIKLLCVSILFICTLGHGKNAISANRADSTMTHLTDSIIQFTPDSLLVNEIFIKRRYTPQLREYIFYKNLKNSASQYRITNFLHNWVVKNQNVSLSKENTSNSRHEQFNGKTIRHIKIRQLVVFGTSIETPNKNAKTFIEKSGNVIQRNTKERIIRNLILLHSGDNFETEIAVDNERIIRAQTFIYDCLINCIPVIEDTTMVDIEFLTQDAFSYGLEVNGSVTRHDIGIFNNNHHGIGNKLYVAVAHSTDAKDQTWGSDFQYTIRNINSSFINLKLLARDTYKDQTFSLDLEKEFITYETKYAGKATVKRVRNASKIYDNDPRFYQSRLNYDCVNIWMGKSFLISKSTTGIRPNNLIIASKISRYAFFNIDSAKERYNLDNFWFWLSEINLAKSNYKKSKLLYGFGRTEDIPYGYALKLLVGNKWTKSTSLPYTGISIAGATKVSDKTGYFNAEVQMGGFLKDNQLSEGVLKGKMEYLSPLLRLRYTLSRHTIAAYYIRGFHRVIGDSLYLNTGNLTIEAFDSNTINGIQKLILSYENTIYLRKKYLGFRVALFSFFDYGGVGINRPLEHDYMSFGGGLKIRNDNLIFNTLLIRVAFTPHHPETMRYRNFRITDEYNRGINGFRKVGITPFVFQ